jgi:hypothetical protein
MNNIQYVMPILSVLLLLLLLVVVVVVGVVAAAMLFNMLLFLRYCWKLWQSKPYCIETQGENE